MEIPFNSKPRPDTGVYNSKVGIWLFLASEVMLFGALFSAYILLRVGAPEDTWVHGLLNIPIGTFNTAVLITSSVTVVLGWAALSPTSARKVYAGVAEVSVYVSAIARGRGVGSELLAALITRSEAHGIWTLQAGIFPENEASTQLHRKHGFREVGTRERLGKMEFGPRQGEWRDVMLFERRSPRVF